MLLQECHHLAISAHLKISFRDSKCRFGHSCALVTIVMRTDLGISFLRPTCSPSGTHSGTSPFCWCSGLWGSWTASHTRWCLQDRKPKCWTRTWKPKCRHLSFGWLHSGWAIRAFAVAALLRALESGVALALEGAFCVDATAVSAQTEVLALVDVCSGRRSHARRV